MKYSATPLESYTQSFHAGSDCFSTFASKGNKSRMHNCNALLLHCGTSKAAPAKVLRLGRRPCSKDESPFIALLDNPSGPTCVMKKKSSCLVFAVALQDRGVFKRERPCSSQRHSTKQEPSQHKIVCQSNCTLLLVIRILCLGWSTFPYPGPTMATSSTQTNKAPAESDASSVRVGSSKVTAAEGQASSMSDNRISSSRARASARIGHPTSSTSCPYHGPIVRLEHAYRSSSGQVRPMERFLSEGSHEQSALYIRGDNSKLSTTKDCNCGWEHRDK
ncbi:hypothetical protein EV356DRAFT_310107 [Viridothelium virens]|uniref:Uncharacterized protein n=1 Tax=Viridothelium virens TaxID=1048519 RepID=A0A6A6GZZ3_VIRVR|nr:hypothetical protein EV356DRAFT_310107 [Viridothelium virens]